MNRLAVPVAITAAIAAASQPALAQRTPEPAWPTKPVRVVVGQAPGGATDLVGRAVAQKLTESLGQTVVIDNRTGAAGSIGAAIVAKSAPDGYTMLLVSSSYSINPSLYAKLPFDPVKDFAPVTLIAEAPFLLVTHPSLPVKSVQDLVAYAKSKPGALSFASGGMGSSGHLAGELFKSLTGAQMLHVPYKGAGPALVDVIAGQVQLTFASVISSLSHVRTAKIRPLAVTGSKRSAALPDLPTVAEAGVKGYATTTWYGLLAPAGTPPAIIQRMNGDVRRALGAADLKERISSDGAEPVGDSPEHFRGFLSAEITKWRKVVAAAGVKLD